MATLNEIRTTLVQQHADIRAHIEETRTATSKWQLREVDYEHVRGFLAKLTSSVRAHNAAEEAALRAVLPTLDAWGPARAEVMVEEHVAEHEELVHTLVEASLAADATAAAAIILKLLDKMLVHMAHEEKAFLSADVLTDHPHSDGFGG